MNRNDSTPTIMDVRMALQDAGALYPQIGVMEEQCRQEEDLRGVKAFVDWMQGEVNHEIRRVAGLATTPGEPVVDIDALETGKEDFLTGGFSPVFFFGWGVFFFEIFAPPVVVTRKTNLCTKSAVLKKKHSKTGEESRFQGTVLGIPAEGKPVIIEGGPFESIQAWEAMMRENNSKRQSILSPPVESSPIDSAASSPLTEIEMDASQ